MFADKYAADTHQDSPEHDKYAVAPVAAAFVVCKAYLGAYGNSQDIGG